MKDCIQLTREALDMFEKMVSEGRPLEEIRVIGDALGSMAYTKQVYDRLSQQQPTERGIQ